MDTSTIIQMIIAILTIVLQFLGGGTFQNKTLSDRGDLATSAAVWSCGKAYWVEAPRTIDNHFEGRVGLDCETEGLSGGGIEGLSQHLKSLTRENSSQVFSESKNEEFEGLPSSRLIHRVTLAVGSDKIDMSGITDVASDGVSILRSVFRSASIPTGGAVGLLKNFQDEIEVIPADKEGRFYVRLLSSSRVERPRLFSESNFKDAMIRGNEERIESRSLLILRDISNHL